MILPIVAYGDPVLRKVGVDIDKDYPNLSELIDNMRETMENAQGVGLAAPQIDKSIRLFLVNTAPFGEDEDLEEDNHKEIDPRWNKLKEYTLDEVAKHNKKSDAWIVINNKVANITEWIPKHPGGDIIMKGVGKDATSLFNSIGHDDYAKKIIEKIQNSIELRKAKK